ncbi:MAG: hypothetical protein WCT85_03680 [Parachlamydiales bacterium]|jgi:hypothetical protein
MVDSTGPIDPFSHLKVEKIEEIAEEEKKDKFFKPQPVDKKLFLYLSFLNLLSSTLSFVNKKKKHTPLNKTPIYQELLNIKSALESLKEKDLSQDPQFLNFFAFTWIKFFNDYKQYSISDEKINNLLKDLIQNIYSYPQDSGFTLGYYISELAGSKWVPFPYIEMLKNLYVEDKKNAQSSHLKKWIELLEDILANV